MFFTTESYQTWSIHVYYYTCKPDSTALPFFMFINSILSTIGDRLFMHNRINGPHLLHKAGINAGYGIEKK